MMTQQSHIHIKQRWHPTATEVKAFGHVALLKDSLQITSKTFFNHPNDGVHGDGRVVSKFLYSGIGRHVGGIEDILKVFPTSPDCILSGSQ